MHISILAQTSIPGDPVGFASDATNAASRWLAENGLKLASGLVAAILIYLVGSWFSSIIKRLVVRLLSSRNMDNTVSVYIGSLCQAVIKIMVIITALGQIGVPTAQFAAIIAAAGLAIGLALQGNLSNFASGFMLNFFRPLKCGDYVEAGGAEGSVEEVGIFTTTLNTLDNRKVVVPNSAITGANITNYSANPKRLVAIPLSLSPANDPSKVREILISTATGNPHCVAEPAPCAIVKELGEGKMVMELRAWCSPKTYWDALFTLNESVKSDLEKGGVIPFLPHQALRILKD